MVFNYFKRKVTGNVKRTRTALPACWLSEWPYDFNALANEISHELNLTLERRPPKARESEWLAWGQHASQQTHTLSSELLQPPRSPNDIAGRQETPEVFLRMSTTQITDAAQGIIHRKLTTCNLTMHLWWALLCQVRRTKQGSGAGFYHPSSF